MQWISKTNLAMIDHAPLVERCTVQPRHTLMSRNARDDKNGRFGEGAPQLTMLAKLAILAIFCQFRQIS